jgi:hypothetical protein
MRWLRPIVSGAAVALLLALMLPPAAEAAPGPLPQQWWFAAWAVTEKIWPVSQGDGVTVAVLDTGVQAELPDFSGAILPGFDATGGGGDGRTDTDTAAVPGHGSGMASVIVAQGRGTGFMGIAPKAKVLPIVTDSVDSVTRGIRFAADHGAKVINISEGAPGGCSDALQQAVDYANQKDAIVVASAGNYGRTTNGSLNPANCVGVLAVGAIDGHLDPWTGTERQPYVAIAAPGVAVGGVLKDGRIHTSDGGTSPAAALTSGGIALLRSTFPDESRTDILQRVFASLRDAGPPGRDDATGYGAFRPARVLGADVPHSAAYDAWVRSSRSTSGRTHAAPQTFAPRHRDADPGDTIKALAVVVVSAVIIVLVALAAFVLFSRHRRQPVANSNHWQLPNDGHGAPGPPPNQTPSERR